MQYLKLNNIFFKYSNIEIFSKLNLDFSNTWSGIVGQNGSGKTTLMKLISKKLKPFSGTIEGNDLVYYCDQTLDILPDSFEEFRDEYTSKRYQIMDLLHIEDEWFYCWDTLSFGEKKRIQIAIALYSQADVLLLDEPTNHLDMRSKQIVIEALKSFKGIGLIVSHDREVLDKLCINTVIIKNKNFYQYKTNYTNARIEFDKQIQNLQKEAQKQNQKRKALKKNIQIQKEKVSKSKAKLSKAHIDKKDKSAKEKINLAKLTGKDKIDSKKVDTLNSKLKQIKEVFINKEYKKGIVLENTTLKNSIFPIFLKADRIKINDQKILSFPNISIDSTDKIALIGDNGAGKSSFFKYLVSKIDQNDILYLPQEIDTKRAQKLFDEIDTLDDSKKGELYTIITRLSSNPKNLIDNRSLSSGELRKLFIAKAMIDSIAFIILDEPTNHMDMDSIFSLEEALRNYKGAILLISHDNIFVRNVAKKLWMISDNILRIM